MHRKVHVQGGETDPVEGEPEQLAKLSRGIAEGDPQEHPEPKVSFIKQAAKVETENRAAITAAAAPPEAPASFNIDSARLQDGVLNVSIEYLTRIEADCGVLLLRRRP